MAPARIIFPELLVLSNTSPLAPLTTPFKVRDPLALLERIKATPLALLLVMLPLIVNPPLDELAPLIIEYFDPVPILTRIGVASIVVPDTALK